MAVDADTDRARPAWFDAALTQREFQRLSAIIHDHVGICLPAAKQTMLESRLKPRLRALELGSFAEYCELIFAAGPDEPEFVEMINQVTTNKTDFFREPGHFDYLRQHALPTLLREHGAGRDRELVVWSAACSTGEEPYTLAMVLAEVQGAARGFQVLATDISTEVLEHAKRGVYDVERVAPVPPALRARYLLQSKDRAQGLVRVAPPLRATVHFRRQNLMDERYVVRAPVDVIFCRNVFIYFDRATQERILKRFCALLVPGGYLFLGHSEAINGLDLPLDQVAPTTYRLCVSRPSRRGHRDSTRPRAHRR